MCVDKITGGMTENVLNAASIYRSIAKSFGYPYVFDSQYVFSIIAKRCKYHWMEISI